MKDISGEIKIEVGDRLVWVFIGFPIDIY